MSNAVGRTVRFLQLETGTACNYRCVYCPVAFHRRRGGFVDLDLVRRIADGLAESAPLEEVYLNGYDEPTLNRRLPEVAEILAPLGGALVLLTNATMLTPELANRLADHHESVRIDVHLSATDEATFAAVHQSRLYHRVMQNLHDLASSPLALNVSLHIGLQAANDDRGRAAYDSLKRLFRESPFEVSWYVPNGRAGNLNNEWDDHLYIEKLGGCASRNRTADWLHINANGKVVLCCQDYFEQYVLGDLATESLAQILDGEIRRRLHAWTIGAESAPLDYICRRCSHAVRETAVGLG